MNLVNQKVIAPRDHRDPATYEWGLHWESATVIRQEGCDLIVEFADGQHRTVALGWIEIDETRDPDEGRYPIDAEDV